MKSTWIVIAFFSAACALPSPVRRLSNVMDDTTIRTAVAAWVSDPTAAEATYGHISTWATGGVTDMTHLFCVREDWMAGQSWYDDCVLSTSSFNEDIGAWDTSGVTRMTEMFAGASAFNQDIGNWAVHSVRDMRGMFVLASAFNHDIGGWAVHNVTDMRGMFDRASAFDQDIGAWDTSGVTAMHYMFINALAFDRDIGDWAVHSVREMTRMFNGASSFNQDLGWCLDEDVDFDFWLDGSIFQDAFSGTQCASTSCGVKQVAGGCAPTPAPTPGALGSDGAAARSVALCLIFLGAALA